MHPARRPSFYLATLSLHVSALATAPVMAPLPEQLCLKFEQGSTHLTQESQSAFTQFLRRKPRYVEVVVRYDSSIQDRAGFGSDIELSAVEFALRRQRAITGEIERFNGGPAQGLWFSNVLRFRESEVNRECQAYVY